MDTTTFAELDLDQPTLVRDCARATADAPRDDPAKPLILRWDDRAMRLEDSVVSLGAHPANHVLLEDRFVSSFHARIHQRDGRFCIRDLTSTNGTFVDGLRISEAELMPGSVIRIGPRELRVDADLPKQKTTLPGFLSRDPSLSPVLELLRRAAPSRIPVMLLGESGSGKEVAARAVHELSRCSSGPFVAVNCGAISHEIAEAELFGHERGSFTGAVGSAPGAFGAADGGTLFLDEIGDLPLALQVKLLRALESGEIKPVGAARSRSIDVRIVCATHHDLRARVQEGAFREDLFFRLKGVIVTLPPLRARPLDILPLAEHFLAHEPRRLTLAPDARAALLAHRWPGNVRELRQVMQLAALFHDGGPIRAAALHLDGTRDHLAAPAAQAEPPVPPPGATLGQLEDAAVRAAHLRHGGNRRAIASELGIARSSLLRKLDRLGLRD